MFFSLSKILNFLVSPYIWTLGLLLAGIVMRRRRCSRPLLVISLCLFFFFSNSFIADIFMRMSERPMVKSEDLITYDAGIVLGGGMVEYDQDYGRLIFRRNTDRVLQAQLLYRQGKIKKIIVSSGSGSLIFRDRLEAPLLRDYLVQSGIPAQDVLLDSTSDNTFQNAMNTAKILRDSVPDGQYLLITSALHMYRAQACFYKAGVATDAFPVSKNAGKLRWDPAFLLLPDPANFTVWDKMMHEWVGILIYKLNGFI